MTHVAIFQLSFGELCESANLGKALLVELVEHGIVSPAQGTSHDEWYFDASAVGILNKARRIHEELLLDWADVRLVLNLLQRIDILEAENSRLKQRLGRFVLELD